MNARQADELARVGSIVSERVTKASRNPYGPREPRYSAEAVQRMIDKDRTIGRREARLIHALLRGRE